MKFSIIKITAFTFVSLLITSFDTPAGLYSIADFFDPNGDNGGQTVANFLTLPVSANQLGQGLVPAIGSMDATDIPFTTANTAFIDQYAFSLSHLEWIMGLRKEYTAACMPLVGIGTFGVFSQVFTFGSFENARDIDEFPSKSRSVEVATGVSFAKAFLNRRLSAGVTASYIESRLAGDGGRAFSANADVMVKPLNWLSGRIYGRNIGSPIKYNDVAEPLPMQAGLAVGFSPIINEDSIGNSNIKITMGLGLQKTIDAPLLIGAGANLNAFKYFSINAGYEFPYGRKLSASGLSAGFGLDIKRYGMDVGWRYQSPEFGSVWSISARFITEELKPKTAMDYYNAAARHFKEGRYRLCIANAKKALGLNPELWQAHALITRAVSRMRRLKGTEIVLIYTANTSGQFVPIAVDETTIGGLARQASAIRKLRKEFPVSLSIDGGNMITANTDILKARFADKYYDLVGYDAVGLGAGELNFGLDRYLIEAKKSSVKLIWTNRHTETGSDIVQSRIIRKGVYSFAVLNVIGPSVLTDDSTKEKLYPALEQARLHCTDLSVKNSDLRILIVNDGWESAQEYARRLPQVEIILCASIPNKFERPVKIDSTLLISTGKYGKYVGALTLLFDKSHRLVSSDNRLIPLTEEIIPAWDIEREAIRISTTLEIPSDSTGAVKFDEDDIQGVFPFVSDRKGTSGIYLKIMNKLMEFPLSDNEHDYGLPRVSFDLGKILFIEQNDSLGGSFLITSDLTGKNRRRFQVDGSVMEACFHSGGRWIYMAVRPEGDTTTDIRRVLADGGEVLPVVSWDGSSEREIAVSPDGGNILFTSDRDGKNQIYITDTVGNVPVLLTKVKDRNRRPEFSSNGRYIAYLSDRFSLGNRMNVFVHDLFTGKSVRITRNINVRDFCWLEDGRSIIYSSGVNISDFNKRDIFSRKSSKFIESETQKDYSETCPRLISYRNIPKVVYVREYLDGERQIFMVNTDGTDDRCIINSDSLDWLE